MDTNELDQLSTLASILRFEKLVAVAIGLGVIVLLGKGVQNLGSRLQLAYPSKRVLLLQIATITNFILYIGGGILVVYGVLRPPQEILLGIAGSAAVAVGIALKDIVASIVAGIVLLFDRPFQVGDRVSFSGTYGDVVAIGLRAAKITTLDDSLVTIPNARFLTDVVSSSNAGAQDMMVVFDFYLALDADIAKAKGLLSEVIATSRFTFRKKPIKVILAEVCIAERLAIQLRGKAYVIDCRFEKDFETDVVERTIMLFVRHEIKRPPRT